MIILNTLPDYGLPLNPADAEILSLEAAKSVEQWLSLHPNHHPTPLHALPALAKASGLANIHIKDEGNRLGIGSFKALGGSYALSKFVLEEAAHLTGRTTLPFAELNAPEVLSVASSMTFCCATDGNHGRSVAAGAQMVGARAVIFVHAGVSQERVNAIARYGARIVRVAGTYDDAVAEAVRASQEQDWHLISDTSWPGYERIPGLVMQGYTAMVQEALQQLPQLPTHVFIQAGVGGLAAAVAGYLAAALGKKRPILVVVEPRRAACLYESVRAGNAIKINHGAPTIMAMLECYEPSLVAWRILSRLADAFMMVEEQDAPAAMKCLARPSGEDPQIIAGESGCVGLAGLMHILADSDRSKLRLGADARVLLINTEGATDPDRYRQLVS
jgi:diaminopropionate ammonia-lyase